MPTTRDSFIPRSPNQEFEEQKEDDDDYDDGGDFRVSGLHVKKLCVFFVLLRQDGQSLSLVVEGGERLSALEDVVDVLYHDALHILEFGVDGAEVPPRPRVRVIFLRLLDVVVEFDEAVGTRDDADAVPVRRVEFVLQVFQIGEGETLGEALLAKGQIHDALFDLIVEN